MPSRKDKETVRKTVAKKGQESATGKTTSKKKIVAEKPAATAKKKDTPTAVATTKKKDTPKPVVTEKKKSDDSKPVVTPAKKAGDVTQATPKKKTEYTATESLHRGTWEIVDNVELEFEARETDIHLSVRRPDDLFVARLHLYNLRIVKGTSPTLRRSNPDKEALLVVELPPQSFGEEAYLSPTGPEVATDKEAEDFETEYEGEEWHDNKNVVTGGEPAPALGATRIRISGSSRLAFKMPTEVTSIAYSLAALLNAARSWPLRRTLSSAAETTPVSNRINLGSTDIINNIAGSDDFNSLLGNVDRLLKELKAKSPKDVRVKSLESLSKQLHEVNDLGRAGTIGQAELDDSKRDPYLPLVAAPSLPNQRVTAVELPYRLITSPIGMGRWTHRTTPFARLGRAELWHTRLTNGIGNIGLDLPTRIRAIWSPDYLNDNLAATLDKPFRMPLDAQDRQMLVKLTTGFDKEMNGGAKYMPKSARADRVILSALGGLLDGEGNWTERPELVDIEQWRHMMSMGRDHYVRVIYAGYLLPFGHSASLIKVTERKFEGSTEGSLTKRTAVLRQRFFVVVREPVKVLNAARHITGGHPFPFTSVELLTRTTPDLTSPNNEECLADESNGKIYADGAYIDGLTPRQLFWPRTDEAGDFRFDVAAIDRDGRRSTFSMPLLFMSEVGNTATIQKKTENRAIRVMGRIRESYNEAGVNRRRVDMKGTSICYAPPSADSAGDPRLPTESITFCAGKVANDSPTELNTYPEVENAVVTLLAAQRILGRGIPNVTVKYASRYKEDGFIPARAGEVFLEIDGPGFTMDFGDSGGTSRTDVVGAVASPVTTIKGISRKIGLASDLAKVNLGTFKPSDFFGDAKILGSIKLSSIVAEVTEANMAAAPKFATREIPASGNTPAKNEARYDWQTTLSGMDGQNLLLRRADNTNPSPFRMQAITTTVVGDPDSARTTATATIGNFKVNLFGFVVLWFRELKFTSEKGKKPEVDVNLHPTQAVDFGGPLEFVNGLKQLLPGNGFSDPSALSVTSSGIEAKYSLTVPKVQVGIFDLCGLSIGARFTLPFDTRPMEVGFNFGERENPFSLTVSLLGGGGFLSIGVGADGIREVEAALEAGSRCAIDLGVASGSVEIKLGIYFHWLGGEGEDDGMVQLSGYVRVHGELEVMMIISMSLTFNLTITFEKRNKESVIWGEASVTVEIEVLVFSGEVTVRCRREFLGSEADPKFAQLMPATNTWSTYCSAFAEA